MGGWSGTAFRGGFGAVSQRRLTFEDLQPAMPCVCLIPEILKLCASGPLHMLFPLPRVPAGSSVRTYLPQGAFSDHFW